MGIRRLIQALPLIAIAILLWNGFKIKRRAKLSLTTNSIRGKASRQHSSKTTVPTYKSWSVVKIADGDTITVRRGSRKGKIRFCGVDAVEADQKLGPQAADYLRSLIGRWHRLSYAHWERQVWRTVAELFVKPRPGIPGYQPENFLKRRNGGSRFARHYSPYSGNCPNKEVIEKSEAIAGQPLRVLEWQERSCTLGLSKAKASEQGNWPKIASVLHKTFRISFQGLADSWLLYQVNTSLLSLELLQLDFGQIV